MNSRAPLLPSAKRTGAALFALAERAPSNFRARARSSGMIDRQRPRLLILAQLPPPEHGAAAVNRQVVNSSLLADLFKVEVIPIRMIAELGQIRRFQFVKIGRSLRLYWGVVQQLFGSTRPDLVYLSLSPSGWAFYRDLLLIALFRAAGLPHVFHLHGRGILDAISRAPWQKPLYRFAFARAFVITLGGLLNREVEGFVRQERIFVVPNGIRDASVSIRGQRLADPPKILFLSNMLKEKGPLLLLDALALLAKRGIPFEMRFAGAWRGWLSPEGFSSRVLELGLEERVAHLGPLYGEAKAEAFAEADIFVLPTYNDALPLVVIEAMMHGLPVVTTKVGALPEIIADQESGDLVEPGNVPALAAALERLILSAKLRASYGRLARTKYETDLTDECFEERLVDVLLRVAGRT